MAVSQNGWSALPTTAGLVNDRWITGKVRAGDVATIFDYLGQRFNAEVEPIVKAHSWGWNYRDIRGATSLSNHASATAVDYNAPAHPLGKSGTFSAAQRAAIDRILASLGGVVRWGGNYSGRKDEMHFEIVGSAAAVAAVAARIRAGQLVSNQISGAGSVPAAVSAARPAPIEPEEDDKVIALARLKDMYNDGRVYVGDGITRTHVKTDQGLKDRQSMIRAGVLKAKTDTVHRVDSLEWLGKEV